MSDISENSKDTGFRINAVVYLASPAVVKDSFITRRLQRLNIMKK